MAGFGHKQDVTWEQVRQAAQAFEGELDADYLETYAGCSEDKALAILEAALGPLDIVESIESS